MHRNQLSLMKFIKRFISNLKAISIAFIASLFFGVVVFETTDEKTLYTLRLQEQFDYSSQREQRKASEKLVVYQRILFSLFSESGHPGGATGIRSARLSSLGDNRWLLTLEKVGLNGSVKEEFTSLLERYNLKVKAFNSNVLRQKKIRSSKLFDEIESVALAVGVSEAKLVGQLSSFLANSKKETMEFCGTIEPRKMTYPSHGHIPASSKSVVLGILESTIWGIFANTELLYLCAPKSKSTSDIIEKVNAQKDLLLAVNAKKREALILDRDYQRIDLLNKILDKTLEMNTYAEFAVPDFSTLESIRSKRRMLYSGFVFAFLFSVMVGLIFIFDADRS